MLSDQQEDLGDNGMMGELFPDFDDALLSNGDEMLGKSAILAKNNQQVTVKKPPTIYKIKLNSSNDLQKILNVANSFNHSQDSSVSSSNRSALTNHCVDNNAKGCMSKNAVAARENRQKKKVYIQNLENSVQRLSTENSQLRGSVQKMKSTMDSYAEEVEYLRGVLANVDGISALMKSISKTPGVNISTSLLTDGNKRKRRRQEADNVNTKYAVFELKNRLR